MLRHSHLHFLCYSGGGIVCCVAELKATLCFVHRSEEMKLLNISILRVRIEESSFLFVIFQNIFILAGGNKVRSVTKK